MEGAFRMGLEKAGLKEVDRYSFTADYIASYDYMSSPSSIGSGYTHKVTLTLQKREDSGVNYSFVWNASSILHNTNESSIDMHLLGLALNLTSDFPKVKYLWRSSR